MNESVDRATRTEFKDAAGNRLLVLNGKIYLYLEKEAGRRGARHIGDFFASSRTLYKKENEKGVFLKFDAFGFCASAISLLDPIEIIVDFRRDRYKISRTMFDAVKKYLHFKDEGFELRTYVPIKDFKKEPRK